MVGRSPNTPNEVQFMLDCYRGSIKRDDIVDACHAIWKHRVRTPQSVSHVRHKYGKVDEFPQYAPKLIPSATLLAVVNAAMSNPTVHRIASKVYNLGHTSNVTPIPSNSAYNAAANTFRAEKTPATTHSLQMNDRQHRQQHSRSRVPQANSAPPMVHQHQEQQPIVGPPVSYPVPVSQFNSGMNQQFNKQFHMSVPGQRNTISSTNPYAGPVAPQLNLPSAINHSSQNPETYPTRPTPGTAKETLADARLQFPNEEAKPQFIERKAKEKYAARMINGPEQTSSAVKGSQNPQSPAASLQNQRPSSIRPPSNHPSQMSSPHVQHQGPVRPSSSHLLPSSIQNTQNVSRVHSSPSPISNLNRYYHPQASVSQVSGITPATQAFQASKPGAAPLHPAIILFRPSPSRQEKVTRFGQDGQGAIFKNQFDRTGGNCLYMPYGLLPPPGSEIVELFDPVDFAGGFKGDWLNDPMEPLNAKAAADATLEHVGSLEDADALLAFNSKRPQDEISPSITSPVQRPPSGPTQDSLDSSSTNASKFGPSQLQLPTPQPAPASTSAQAVIASPRVNQSSVGSASRPLPPSNSNDAFQVLPASGTSISRPSLGPKGRKRPAAESTFEILSEVVDFAVTPPAPASHAASPTPSLEVSGSLSPDSSPSSDTPLPPTQSESQNMKRKLAETDRSDEDNPEETTKRVKNAKEKEQEEWEQKQASLSDRLDAEMLANINWDSHRGSNEEFALRDLPAVVQNTAASVVENSEDAFWDQIDKINETIAMVDEEEGPWQIDGVDAEDIFCVKQT